MPERPIFGNVRERSIAQHAARLAPDAYSRHITGSATKPSIAVIGAGISGLFCARTLSDHGFDVQVFDKGRRPGGRMSTRRVSEGLQFDHGAQYFTARDPHFQRYVHSWCGQGLVAEWPGRIVSVSRGQLDDRSSSTNPRRRFVGAPGMSAICRHLGKGLTVHFGVLVAPPRRANGGWRLRSTDAHDLGVFDLLVVAVPAPQAAELLLDAPALAKAAARARMTGCWALMLGFDTPLEVPYDGAFIGDGPLSWIARNSSKPGRPKVPDTWVGHASPEWSQQNLEEPKGQVEESLRRAFFEAIGISPRQTICSAAHRWRYALPPVPLSVRCLFDDELAVGTCGDWCSGPRVEGAFLSGMATAGRILNMT
jgi:predicted NAD/FAD-dependent oxidoreductase